MLRGGGNSSSSSQQQHNWKELVRAAGVQWLTSAARRLIGRFCGRWPAVPGGGCSRTVDQSITERPTTGSPEAIEQAREKEEPMPHKRSQLAVCSGPSRRQAGAAMRRIHVAAASLLARVQPFRWLTTNVNIAGSRHVARCNVRRLDSEQGLLFALRLQP